MQLARYTDLGLRVLILLQQRIQDKDLSTVDGLASELQVSRHHLVKIVHFMAKSGWIQSYKGRSGGIRLNASTSKLLLGTVISLLEKASSSSINLINCHKPPCSLFNHCKLPMLLNAAQQAFYDHLNQYQLQDLAFTEKTEQTIHFHLFPSQD